MKLMLEEFLKDKVIMEKSIEDFDYNFDDKSSYESFIEEFKKFWGFHDGVFYYKNRFVTVFNSYEIRLKKEDLRAIARLYLYSKKNDLKYYQYIIADYLYTYQITINNKEYESTYLNHLKSKEDFSQIMDELNMRKLFFVDIPNELHNFYEELIDFCLDKDIFIDGDTLYKIFNNMKFAKKKYKELFEKFFAAKKHISILIKFDDFKKDHLDIYLEYINDSLNQLAGYNCVKEIIFELDKAKCLNEDNIDQILNQYVRIINELVNKLMKKDSSFIQGISEIETLRKELLFLLENIESFSEREKEKIKECLSLLLKVKRFIVSDNEYIKTEMLERTFEFKIPNEEIEKLRKSLMENKFGLYNASKRNFIKDMAEALETYAKYPLSSIVSRYTIDSKREVYLTNIEERKKREDNNFKKYFDQLGEEYTKKHPKLTNKLNDNYYEELLKYQSKTFNLHQNILLSSFTKEEFESIINELKELINYNFENKYSIVVGNILAIETNIIKILEYQNIPVSRFGLENLNVLFELCKDNEDKVNGLMYINYILYEKSGYNLRNNSMHGMLINEDLTIPLLLTFSGLIFVSWLLREEVNEL